MTGHAEELRALKIDHGLLRLVNEQLAHSYKLADQCAHEREIEILRLGRERNDLAASLASIIDLAEASLGDFPSRRAECDKARELLESIGYEVRG